MKKRYNITINESVMDNAKKYIKNVSAFLEVCLKNYVDKCKDNERIENEKELKRQIEIASYNPWID